MYYRIIFYMCEYCKSLPKANLGLCYRGFQKFFFGLQPTYLPNPWSGILLPKPPCLIQYSSEKRILPDTQVAAQPGVQTWDLMSFLASVKFWATRHKEPVYALKCDQMKGFNYLAPEGFHDAIQSYGLLQSIIDIDKAAQKDTKCFIRTAYGVTIPIVVSDVNKQGGPLIRVKSI